MLENGIIEQSFSPFSSPVTLVTKRDKTKRFCIDYRKVNELISSDVHPLPRIEDILDRLAQAKYFSTADISSAYWQVPIHPDSRPLLAFATFEGLYQPTRLPFGLKTSPQIYERAISQVLQRHGLDCVAHYFDDFIIYSNTLEEHQNHLRQFFAFCEAEKLQLNFAKCEFFKQSINFLGYTITAGTITPLTRNTDIIHAIKQQHNRKTLQSFLGALNVYNKFIPEYARLRAPLNNLLKKDVVWNWNEACQEAFIDLKGKLTQHPILHLYKEGLPCQVYCDASTLGIAGVLKQVHPDGNIYPVQYFSRTLRPHEKNYSISELECLAIVESVEKFRIYLMGRKFTIFSDHHALQWLKTIKNPSGRLFRWSLRLSSYEYEVRYIKGKLQYEADLLSRNPFCGFLDATLIKTHQPPPSKESSLTIDRNGLHTVSRKVGPTYGELSQPPESKESFDLLSLDTIAGFAKYGNTKIYLHVVVDHFSRYAWAFPSKSTSTTTYQQVLKRVSQDGSPKRLLTDRAHAFTSPKFRSFLLNRNIHPLLTTSNNPQANGLCERLNATLTGKLRLLHLENPKVAWTKGRDRTSLVTAEVILVAKHSILPDKAGRICDQSGAMGNGTDNGSWLEESLGPIRGPLETVVPMTAVYALILVTGVTGNVATCIVIARNKYMHTATNYYLFSLAVSDLLLLLLGLPNELYELWVRYPYAFGKVFCFLRGLVSETSTNASILTIAAFTVERYVAICHPLKAHTMSSLPRVVRTVVAAWALAGLAALPLALPLGIVMENDPLGRPMPESARCLVTDVGPYPFLSHTLVFFVVPVSLICVLYVFIGLELRAGRDSPPSGSQRDSSRRAVVKMLAATLDNPVISCVIHPPVYTDHPTTLSIAATLGNPRKQDVYKV
ncbi:hypothetical protein LAZ67_17003042 [Cordylochernes scorpioides]|uniref:Thyroliberin receptor n=1 Tax=Cordylochernes scorpioides TaxID=51811 RepID=A0ABY6LEC4_9ARAC|nr:hypothetical protein LAZ67_17003042 [Cordylochernes scorpioides]